MHICVLLCFWQLAIYLKFQLNHILYEKLKDVVIFFLNNSIQANYNYFAVCVCVHIGGKKGQRADSCLRELFTINYFCNGVQGWYGLGPIVFLLSGAALWCRGITQAKLFPHVFRQGSVPTALTVIICRNCADYLN